MPMVDAKIERLGAKTVGLCPSNLLDQFLGRYSMTSVGKAKNSELRFNAAKI